MKVNGISFGAKMVVKWPIRPITDQGPIPGFVLSKHPTFWRSQKRYEMQKVARVKQARKRRAKGQEKSLKQAMAKKLAYAHAPN